MTAPKRLSPEESVRHATLTEVLETIAENFDRIAHFIAEHCDDIDDWEIKMELAQSRAATIRQAPARIAALEAEIAEGQEQLRLLNAVCPEDEEAMRNADTAYQWQRDAEHREIGETSWEKDVPSNALYRGNSVGWTYLKAENYKKALGRVWDELTKGGIKPDGKTHCADAVATLISREAQAIAQEREACAKVAEEHYRKWKQIVGDWASKEFVEEALGVVKNHALAIAAAIRARSDESKRIQA